MTTISTKLAFVALAVAMVATPAFAANKHHPATVYYRGLQNSAVGSRIGETEARAPAGRNSLAA